jgi:hypothetical protein
MRHRFVAKKPQIRHAVAEASDLEFVPTLFRPARQALALTKNRERHESRNETGLSFSNM